MQAFKKSIVMYIAIGLTMSAKRNKQAKHTRTELSIYVGGITMETSHGLLYNSKINLQYRILTRFSSSAL